MDELAELRKRVTDLETDRDRLEARCLAAEQAAAELSRVVDTVNQSAIAALRLLKALSAKVNAFHQQVLGSDSADSSDSDD